MKKKYLKTYVKALETGYITRSGLCMLISELSGLKGMDEFLDLFMPSTREFTKLYKEGKSCSFWASYLSRKDLERMDKFTPLREIILLLWMAQKGYL